MAKKPSKSNDFRDANERDLADKDPADVLRRMLAISPEDAERVREAAKREPRD